MQVSGKAGTGNMMQLHHQAFQEHVGGSIRGLPQGTAGLPAPGDHQTAANTHKPYHHQQQEQHSARDNKEGGRRCLVSILGVACLHLVDVLAELALSVGIDLSLLNTNILFASKMLKGLELIK